MPQLRAGHDRMRIRPSDPEYGVGTAPFRTGRNPDRTAHRRAGHVHHRSRTAQLTDRVEFGLCGAPERRLPRQRSSQLRRVRHLPDPDAAGHRPSGRPGLHACAVPSSYSILSPPTPSTGPSGTVATVFATGLTAVVSDFGVTLTPRFLPGTADARYLLPVALDPNGDATVTFTVPGVRQRLILGFGHRSALVTR